MRCMAKTYLKRMGKALFNGKGKDIYRCRLDLPILGERGLENLR